MTAAPQAELMPSLGRLVKGLSALFWGLPVAIVVCFQTANTAWLASVEPYGLVMPVVATAVLLYGLHLMSDFQRQERIWMAVLERAKIIGLVNVGLSPFLHWHQQLPEEPFFHSIVSLLALSGLLFLYAVNQVLKRLAAMLPDETLRLETRAFTSLSSLLLALVPLSIACYGALTRIVPLPPHLAFILRLIDPLTIWILLFLIVLPTSITMSLLWKTKEAILASIFGTE